VSRRRNIQNKHQFTCVVSPLLRVRYCSQIMGCVCHDAPGYICDDDETGCTRGFLLQDSEYADAHEHLPWVTPACPECGSLQVVPVFFDRAITN